LGEPVDQLSNRLLWLAGVLGVLLLAVIANYLLHGDEGGLNPVAQAAERTAHLPGGKLAMEVSYTAPGLAAPIVGNGGGTFDAKSGRSQMVLSIPVPGRGTETMTAVGDKTTVFMRSSTLSAELPPGRVWLKMQPTFGHDPQTALGSSGGAESTIEMLSAVGGDVSREGQEKVRGHLATRYKATIDFSRVSEVLAQRGETELAHEYEELADKVPSTIPVEVWIDQQGIARRIEMVQELPAGETGVTVTMDMTMELFDFGKQPKIDLPSSDEAFDVTPLTRVQLGLVDGGALEHLIAPTGGAPLPRAQFRRKGNAICREEKRQSKVGPPIVPLKQYLRGAGSKEELVAKMRRWSATYVRPGIKLGEEAGRRLAHLTPPAADAAEYAAALKKLAMGVERLQALAVALELGSMPALKQVGEEETAHKDEADAELRRLGLDACVGDDSADEGQSDPGQSGASIE
jgi:hypothetical protein